MIFSFFFHSTLNRHHTLPRRPPTSFVGNGKPVNGGVDPSTTTSSQTSTVNASTNPRGNQSSKPTIMSRSQQYQPFASQTLNRRPLKGMLGNHNSSVRSVDFSVSSLFEVHSIFDFVSLLHSSNHPPSCRPPIFKHKTTTNCSTWTWIWNHPRPRRTTTTIIIHLNRTYH